MLDQVGGLPLVHPVRHPPALTADAAAADVEDLDGHLERVLGQRDHVDATARSQRARD